MPAARPDLRHPITVRLTTAQDTHIRALARERETSPSEALRALVDAGIVMEQASRLGVVVTAAARALLADGHATHVGFALALTPEQLDALGVPESLAQAHVDGAALVGTREELYGVAGRA
jgi:hypothetical protein